MNLPIADFNGDQGQPKIAASGDGSTWMTWFDQRGGTYAVYAQRLNAQGVETFAHGGILVSGNPQSSSLQDWDMISDGAGGCVIAFTDTRSGPDLDVYAYRLDVAGNQLWGANGVTLSADADGESNPTLCRTTDGFFVCAWAHTPSSGAGHIRIQKIDGAGALQYPANGILITGAGSDKPGNTNIAGSDSGSYIVSYLRATGFSSPRHVYAQKFDAAGNALWNTGSPVIVYDNNAIAFVTTPQLRSDGAGGAVLAWYATIGINYESRVQRLSSIGAESYAHNGITVSTDTTAELNPQLSIDAASGDAFVFFIKQDNSSSPTMWSFSVQRVSTAGTLLFGNPGIDLIPIDTTEKFTLRSAPLGTGAVAFSFRRLSVSTFDLVGFCIDGSGNSLWGAAPLVACSVVSDKFKLGVAADASNTTRMVWGDKRNDVSLGYGFDIYAQDVGANGSLGIQDTPSTAFCFGDGTDTTCPCGINGTAGRGCENTFTTGGASISSTGVASISTDTLTLHAANTGPFQFGLYFEGSATANPTAPFGVVFGNGVRCVNFTGANRLEIQQADLAGASATTVALSIPGFAVAGTTYYYQLWYRDGIPPTVLGTCNPTAGFNFSHALSLTWGL